MIKIALLYLTYNRILDVKTGMEIIRNIWPSEEKLKDVEIFHAYNGSKKNYPHKYLEDHLIRRKNLGHIEGASDLLNKGIGKILKSKTQYDLIMVMSSDVWLVEPKQLSKTISEFLDKNYLLAGTLWINDWLIPCYFSTEFFIIKPEFARLVFPLELNKNHMNFATKYAYHIMEKIPFLTITRLESSLTNKILKITKSNRFRNRYIYLIPGRKVFTFNNRYYSPKLGYLSHHNLKLKYKLALKSSAIRKDIDKCKVLKAIPELI